MTTGTYIATHPNSDMVLQQYNMVWMKDYSTEIEATLKNGGNFSTKAFSDVTKSNITFLGSSITIGDTNRNWIICGIIPQKTVNASSTTLLWIIIAIGIAIIAFTGITIFLIIHRYLRKLPPVADAAQKISEGNFDVTVGSNDNNEIADVSNALLHVKQTVQRLANDIKNMSNDFKTGSIHIKIDESSYRGNFKP